MNQLVFKSNDQVVTSSRNIARDFGKEHKNVLRDIRGLLKNEPAKEMFFETTYIHEANNQEFTKYLMNRDGFTLLVMGFTGRKAMQFKMQYIQAFNEMEKQIKELSKPSYMIDDPVERAERWIVEQKEKQALRESNEEKEKIIDELKPKADYTDVILQNKGLVTITQIAKDYGMTGQSMNKLLHELKIQYKQSGQWLLYKEHSAKGYVHSDTFPITRKDGRADVSMTTKWTQKGRLFIYETLKEEKGLLPIIERENEQLRLVQ